MLKFLYATQQAAAKQCLVPERALLQQFLRANVCAAVQSRPKTSATNPQGLPYLPVPKLEDTLAKFLKSVEPHLDSKALARTQALAKEFETGVGPKLQKLLEEHASKKENWLSDWWLQCAYLEYRDPVVVWSSPGLVFPQRKFKSEEDRLVFTSKVISAALTYKNLIDAKKIPTEMAGKMPLDMQQYNKIFGTCRIPGLERDNLSFHPDSRHIVLVIDNEYYKIPVFNKAKEVLSENQILSQIKKCLNEQKGRKIKSAPIGLLSTDKRDNWGKAYAELMSDPKNKASVREIQSSLFTISLDKFMSSDKDDIVTAEHQLIHGGGSKFNAGNRWYDKTLQLVVGNSGINGLTYEHSPAEGGPIAVLTDFIINYVDSNRKENANDVKDLPHPEHLPLYANSSVKEALSVAASNIDALVANLDMNYLHFTKYGKNFIKTQKMSPDSYVQMAIQYAFYRLHKVPGAHYESAQTRLYVHGRTETIRSCSNESVAFAKAMTEGRDEKEKVEKLKAAVNAHKKYVAAAVQGFGVDRHLLGLKLIANANKIPLPELYTDDGYKKSSYMRLSTSNVSSKYDAFMCYGPLVEDGYGCCYNLKNDDLWFGVSSMRSCKETNSEKFKVVLSECLTHMYELLSKHGEPPKSKL
ncbi:carnitine O-acetyltransferase-like isoform X2 [Culicoides brevitarsis]